MFDSFFWKSLIYHYLGSNTRTVWKCTAFSVILHILGNENGINISILISQESYSGRKTVCQYKINTVRHKSWKSVFYLPHKKI